MAEARSGALIDIEAAHGLEQHLIHALIECLSTGLADEETPTARRHREILARFEDLLQADLFLSTSEICAALGVAERTLRECCRKLWAWARAVTVASAGCNRCAARCGA
jgi:hypothetical protein